MHICDDQFKTVKVVGMKALNECDFEALDNVIKQERSIIEEAFGTLASKKPKKRKPQKC